MPLLRKSPSTIRTRSLRARLHREEGASLLEFALSLGIFLAATLGLIFLCLALFTYEYVNFASQKAARWAAVRGADCSADSSTMPGCNADTADIQNYVRGLNYPIVTPGNIAVTATWYQVTYTVNSAGTGETASWTSCGVVQCNAPGNEVQVNVSYPYTLAIPFAGSHTFTISSTSTMVIAQ